MMNARTKFQSDIAKAGGFFPRGENSPLSRHHSCVSILVLIVSDLARTKTCNEVTFLRHRLYQPVSSSLVIRTPAPCPYTPLQRSLRSSAYARLLDSGSYS